MLLSNTLRNAGAADAHVGRALRVWLAGSPLSGHVDRPQLPFPKTALACLPELDAALDSLLSVELREADEDGEKLLCRMPDGRAVEAVLLDPASLCISSQVGCAVGCGFCKTGTFGLDRQLTTDEILAQVVVARRVRPVRRVLFMGMGEPGHNLSHVLEAIACLGVEGCIGHKDLVFSTVGDPKIFDALRENAVQPALALSLHTTFDERRRELLPRAPEVGARKLLEAALDYGQATGHPLQLQWTLLAGINDGDDELERLIGWLKGRRVVVNFISYNPVDDFPHKRTSAERTLEMTHALHAAGILAKLRNSAGQGVSGGCGQLRARGR
ncbi:MAG: 23S rRNA (adenine2503-C2)-methyltransferase [Planctomycetota bacterium]|jgi:23S rRNA (adenine2503-C2)-methyltransferase